MHDEFLSDLSGALGHWTVPADELLAEVKDVILERDALRQAHTETCKMLSKSTMERYELRKQVAALLEERERLNRARIW